MHKDDQKIIDMAQAVIKTEARAVLDLQQRINTNFIKAHHLLLHCQGRIVVTGIGKSGHIGNKIAATLASTGSPAFFIHPAEASHGDLGMITKDDVLLVISYSGETQEVINLMPTIKMLDIPIISLTGNAQSTIAEYATTNLDISVEEEACPLSLAPTSSTTSTLVMGDALAITLLSANDFTEADFARSHPGGALGKRLLQTVEKLMHCASELPVIDTQASFKQAVKMISSKKLGHVLVVEQGELVGLVSDGDVRRAIENGINANDDKNNVKAIMTVDPATVKPTLLASEALNIMEQKKITALPVLSDSNQILGLIHLHDILRAGIL